MTCTKVLVVRNVLATVSSHRKMVDDARAKAHKRLSSLLAHYRSLHVARGQARKLGGQRMGAAAEDFRP